MSWRNPVPTSVPLASVCSCGWSQKRALFVAVLSASWPSPLDTLTTPSSNTSTPTWRTARSDFLTSEKHTRALFLNKGKKKSKVTSRNVLIGLFSMTPAQFSDTFPHNAEYPGFRLSLFPKPPSSFVHSAECYWNSRQRQSNSAVSWIHKHRWLCVKGTLCQASWERHSFFL